MFITQLFCFCYDFKTTRLLNSKFKHFKTLLMYSVKRVYISNSCFLSCTFFVHVYINALKPLNLILYLYTWNRSLKKKQVHTMLYYNMRFRKLLTFTRGVILRLQHITFINKYKFRFYFVFFFIHFIFTASVYELRASDFPKKVNIIHYTHDTILKWISLKRRKERARGRGKCKSKNLTPRMSTSRVF
jgi:hypothetical protein